MSKKKIVFSEVTYEGKHYKVTLDSKRYKEGFNGDGYVEYEIVSI